MAEVETQAPGPVTLTQIHALIAEQVIPRLDSVEGTVNEHTALLKASGLNGYTPLLKSFLEQYGATYTKRQAWQTVRSDVAHRFRWLASPRSWVKAIFYAFLGGLGWEIASGGQLSIPTHLFH